MKLWVVGKYIAAWPDNDIQNVWDLVGIFDSEDKAVAACTTPDKWVGSTMLNELAPEEPTIIPECYYPHERTAVSP